MNDSIFQKIKTQQDRNFQNFKTCLLYTSDAADEL